MRFALGASLSARSCLAQVKVLVTFFISKLEDTDTIVPALKGLVSLSSRPTFTDLDAVELAKAYDGQYGVE